MRNSKIQFLFIFFISIFASKAFGIDYFWVNSVELEGKPLIRGINVGEMSIDKIREYFGDQLTFLSSKSVAGSRFGLETKIDYGVLGSKIFVMDEVYNRDEESVGIFLKRTLLLNPEKSGGPTGYIALPSRYQVKDYKSFTLRKIEKGDDEFKEYYKALKVSGENELVNRVRQSFDFKKKAVIFIAKEEPRFAMNGQFLFWDKKPVFYSQNGFGSLIRDDDDVGYLLKINKDIFFLANFEYTSYHKKEVKAFGYGFYLINLSKGRGYLPMHLRKTEGRL